MKKSLIALAALSAFAGTAAAQSTVTVYGAVGASSTTISTNGVDAATAFQNADRDFLGTTALGFKGTEDLGGGNKAFFNLEGDLSMSGVLGGSVTSTSTSTSVSTFTGTALGTASYASTIVPAGNVGTATTTTTTTTSQNIFNRQAHIGLETKFGTLSFGRQNDSVKDTEGLRQVYNLSDATVNNTIVGDRIANSYKYKTPVIQGFQAQYTYSNNPANADTTTTDSTTTHNSYAITYKLPVNGGIDLAYAYGKEKIHTTGAQIETTLMSARTEVMGVTIGAGLALNENQAGDELKQTLVSVSKPFGPYEVKAHYVKNSQTGNVIGTATDNTVAGDGYGLMGVYNFSKRTAGYVATSDFKADAAAQKASANIKFTTLGVIHKF